MWVHKAGRFWTKKDLKRTIAKQRGVIDGIWEAGPYFRAYWNVREDQPDYYLAVWRVKV